MNLRIIEGGGRNVPLNRLHLCAACGLSDAWGPTWEWYGSLRDEDDGKAIKSCSAACRQKLIATGKTPP